MSSSSNSHPVGVFIGGPPNPVIDLERPFAGCRICGAIYQPELPTEHPLNKGLRDTWRMSHAATHTDNERRLLKLSGKPFTPEAAIELARVGVIDLVALSTDEEYISAYKE